MSSAASYSLLGDMKKKTIITIDEENTMEANLIVIQSVEEMNGS